MRTVLSSLFHRPLAWLQGLSRQGRWALGLLLGLYLTAALAAPLAPYSPYQSWPQAPLAPPSPLYWVSPQGQLTWPYTLPQQRHFNPRTLRFYYTPLLHQPQPLQWGVHNASGWHLLGVPNDAAHGLHWLGTDSQGRDLFSRLLWGGQITLSVGFAGLLVAFPLGLVLGGLAGYLGGWVDTLLMRGSEVLMTLPSLYILISIAALLPPQLSSSQRFLLVTLALALLGWMGLARVVRNLVRDVKAKDYVLAAQSLGSGTWGVLWRHILPQTKSYVGVALTLSIPGYMLAESGLSFLGLGIQQPEASWGNLLREAQDLSNLVERPWMLAPGLCLLLAIWGFNTLGNALQRQQEQERS